MANVVRTRIFVRHIEDSEAVARAHGHVFAETRPANPLLVARSTSVSACDLSRPRTAGLVGGRRQAASIEGMTLSKGEGHRERARSRRSALLPQPSRRSPFHRQIRLICGGRHRFRELGSCSISWYPRG